MRLSPVEASAQSEPGRAAPRRDQKVTAVLKPNIAAFFTRKAGLFGLAMNISRVAGDTSP